MEKSIKLTSLNRKEALRYLGYKKNAPDERVEELMDECEELVLKTAVPRFIYKKFDLQLMKTVWHLRIQAWCFRVSLLRSTCINVIVQYAWL